LTDSSPAGIRQKLIRYRICIPPFEHDDEHDCSHHDLFIIARQGAMRRSAKSKKLMQIKNDLIQGRDHSEGGMKSLAFYYHCNEEVNPVDALSFMLGQLRHTTNEPGKTEANDGR
jgi:hypothetical protein